MFSGSELGLREFGFVWQETATFLDRHWSHPRAARPVPSRQTSSSRRRIPPAARLLPQNCQLHSSVHPFNVFITHDFPTLAGTCGSASPTPVPPAPSCYHPGNLYDCCFPQFIDTSASSGAALGSRGAVPNPGWAGYGLQGPHDRRGAPWEDLHGTRQCSSFQDDPIASTTRAIHVKPISTRRPIWIGGASIGE